MEPSYQALMNAVTFGTLKRAALFFPRVFPAALPTELWSLQNGDLHLDHRFVEIMGSLLARPGHIPALDAAEWMTEWLTPTTSYVSRIGGNDLGGKGDEMTGVLHAMMYRHGDHLETLEGDLTSYRAHLQAMIEKFGLQSPALVFPEVMIAAPGRAAVPAAEFFGDRADSASAGDSVRTLLVSLSNVGLANADVADWGQIVEIRRDEAAMRQLRNLRLFLHESYLGRERSFIMDDLARRMEEYRAATRKHGLELITGSISAMMDPTSLAGVAAVAVAGTAVGGATVGISAAVVGGALHAAKASLDLLGKAQEREQFVSGSELAYVFRLQGLKVDSPTSQQDLTGGII